MKSISALWCRCAGAFQALKPKDQRDVICLLLPLVIVATYLPVIKCNFVNYDDPGYVILNSHVNGGLTLDNLKWSLTTLHGDVAYWHPITWVSHQLDSQLFESNAGAHHLTSVLIHAATTVFVFLIARRLVSSMTSGFITALFWGIHPLRVESVAWISERKDVLCGFFYFLTILLYFWFAERRTWKAYATVLLCFVFALMSKPMAVTLPCALLLLDFWPLGRIQIDSSLASSAKSLIRPLVEKVPFLATAAVGSYFAYKAQHDLHAMAPVLDLPFAERLANVFVASVAYIEKTFLPINLSAHYDHPRFHPILLVCVSLVMFSTISGLAIRVRRQQPAFLFGWLWFLGTLVPTNGLIQVGSQWMANRYTYIPALGLLLMTVSSFKHWMSAISTIQLKAIHRIILAGTAALSAVLIYDTETQIATWKNMKSLFLQVTKIDPMDYAGNINLGLVYEHEGRIDLALRLFQTAIRTNPDSGYARTHIARILIRQGKPEFAIALLEQALKSNERVADRVYERMGRAYAKLGLFSKAVHNYRRAIDAEPSKGAAKIRFAELLATAPEPQLRNGSDAVKFALEACKGEQLAHAGYRAVLAAAYAQNGDFQNAIKTAEGAAARARAVGNWVLEAQLSAALCSYRDRKTLRKPSPTDLCDGSDAHLH